MSWFQKKKGDFKNIVIALTLVATAAGIMYNAKSGFKRIIEKDKIVHQMEFENIYEDVQKEVDNYQMTKVPFHKWNALSKIKTLRAMNESGDKSEEMRVQLNNLEYELMKL